MVDLKVIDTQECCCNITIIFSVSCLNLSSSQRPWIRIGATGHRHGESSDSSQIRGGGL